VHEAGGDAAERRWRLGWPMRAAPARLVDTDGRVLAELPPERATPVLHPKRWWNALIANPGGYLADDAPIDALRLELPATEVLGFGPDWMRGWPFLYFVLLIAGAIWLKIRWKVH